MPYRRIEGSASDYEYTESDEETGTGIVPNASYGEDSEDKWDVDVQTLCQKRCLFTFKLGCRIISAWGRACSKLHPNVHRLEIPRGWINCLPQLDSFPRFLHTWLLTYCSEWFLPPTVVLKRQKPQWEEEFEREKEGYAKIRPLQGVFFPICYGEVHCCFGGDWHGNTQKRRSLLLSELGGWDLNSDECPLIEAGRLEAMLREALEATVRFGLIPTGDGRLENIRFVGEKIMFVDLESYTAVPKDESHDLVELEIRYLLREYLEHQKAVAYEKQSYPKAQFPKVSSRVARG